MCMVNGQSSPGASPGLHDSRVLAVEQKWSDKNTEEEREGKDSGEGRNRSEG